MINLMCAQLNQHGDNKNMIHWQEKQELQQALWCSEAGNMPPKKIVVIDDTIPADDAYKWACEGAAMLYRGDFQNAKQLLQAITRRVDRKLAKPLDSLNATFHQHRARQIQRANITHKILIELQHGQCNLRRAPDVKEAVTGAMMENVPARMVLSLRELLGMIGAHEWRKKGVFIEALQTNIHAHYGVYSPIRGEYLDLIANKEVDWVNIAFDIGTGTGVIAAVLAKLGVDKIIATDNQPRALICAQENIVRLGLQRQVQVMKADLFPPNQRADLIICNPPWLPAKANASIEHAVYDPNSQMLKNFLNGVQSHLNPKGEAWLIMSNLAEHLGLRSHVDLLSWIKNAGLNVIEKKDIAPRHSKVSDRSDPLYEARSQEVTSLYRLNLSIS